MKKAAPDQKRLPDTAGLDDSKMAMVFGVECQEPVVFLDVW